MRFNGIPAIFFLCVALCGGSPAENAPKAFVVHPRSFQVGPNPCDVVALDINDDDIPDIVTADRGELHDPREERPANDEISVLMSDTPFNYNYIRRYPSLKTGFAPYALALANVDALKFPDIISVNFHAGRSRIVSVFLNFKDEGIFKPLEFKAPENIAPYQRHYDGAGAPLYTAPGLTSVAVADIDGDELRDLAASAWSNDSIMIMRGHQDTVFSEPVFFPLSGAPRALTFANLDGDGKPDLIVALYATSEVALLQGDGHGGFTEKNRFNSRGNLPTTVNFKDINGDGRGDIVVTHSHTDDNIVVFYGDGPFSFSVSQELSLGKDHEVLEYEIRDAAIADLNGDGTADIAVACSALPGIVVLLNDSENASIPQRFRREEYEFKEGSPRALDIADLDSNGHLDIVVSLGVTNSVSFLRNTKK